MSADLMRRAAWLLRNTDVPLPEYLVFPIIVALLASGEDTTARVKLAQAIVDAAAGTEFGDMDCWECGDTGGDPGKGEPPCRACGTDKLLGGYR